MTSQQKQSSNIVTLLRRYGEDVLPHYPNDLCSEAADEIERLKQLLKDAYEALAWHDGLNFEPYGRASASIGQLIRDAGAL